MSSVNKKTGSTVLIATVEHNSHASCAEILTFPRAWLYWVSLTLQIDKEMNVANADEIAWIEQCRQGHATGFRALYERYATPVFNLSLRILANAADAEDATQETFLRFFRALDSFRGDAKAFTWIYRIAWNVCQSSLANRARLAAVATAATAVIARGRVPTGANQDDVQKQVQSCLNAMPDEARALLVMRLVQGLSYRQIVEIVPLQDDQVRNRLYRAKLQFRELFQLQHGKRP